MTSNTDITIYHRYVAPGTRLDAYDRHTARRVLWEECKAVNVIKSGMESSDAFRVYVPYQALSGIPVAPGDIIAKGLVTKEIGADYTVAKFQKEHICFLVTSVDCKDFGNPGLWHYEIGGK